MSIYSETNYAVSGFRAQGSNVLVLRQACLASEHDTQRDAEVRPNDADLSFRAFGGSGLEGPRFRVEACEGSKRGS